MTALVVALAAPALSSGAGAQPAPSTTLAVAPSPSTTSTTTTLPTPTASTAHVGGYGAPRWLPLRRDAPGGEVTVGCTYDSHGSQHGYECAGHHDRWALDFMAAAGTPIYAAGPGFATNITGKPGGGGFGNVVRIDHGFGVSTVYAHMTVALVPAEGKWVDETTLIGTVGQTGSASAPHLHFEEFALPAGSTSLRDQVSVDPGPLFACRGPVLVSYPQAGGFGSWQGLPWGSLHVASDGHDCLDGATKPAEPATPVPAPKAATPDAPDPSSAAEPDAATSDAWSDLIAPVLNIVGHSTRTVTDIT